MPEIVFIMGKSASGKDKIYKNLLSDDELNLKPIIMYTTRPMRVGEKNGVEYYYVTDEFADDMIKQNKIVEMRSYDTVCGVWRYFTVDDGQINLYNKEKYIVIGTLEAYEKYCQYYGNQHFLPIYIEVDDGVRLSRALHREMKQKQPRYDEMCRRYLADMKDFAEENIEKNHIKVRYYNNGELSDCINNIKSAIKNCDI
mgnify:FL=1